MTNFNRYGLCRTIPADVKRQVRQRCGFGCVICGLALYDFEHFDPDFKDATAHCINGITLLCMQCNQKRRRGHLSVDSVRAANINPRCLQQGFANEMFDYGVDNIEICFSGLKFTECNHLIEVNKFPILSIKSPEIPSQPFRLSGRFSDNTGDITLKIIDNEWFAGADNWDVECQGQRIIIRNGPRDVSLILRTDPPKRLFVEKLNMQFEGISLRVVDDSFEVSFNGKTWSTWKGCSAHGCNVGISLSNRP